MKKFKFQGNPDVYDWKIKPVKGCIYTVEKINSMRYHSRRWKSITEKDISKWEDFIEIKNE
jgi:hypothetical protein